MLARLERELPTDGDWIYEPKWDGFRCIAFRDGTEVDLRSRNDRPLARYFPEIVVALLGVKAPSFVIDGELLVTKGEAFDFPSLMARLHPARSRVERLAGETPGRFVVFDALAIGADDLRELPFAERRRRLLELDGVAAPLFVTPATADAMKARRWLDAFRGNGVDGVVAKRRTTSYQSGRRALTKVKSQLTADCAVAGFRWYADQPVVGALLLALYDGEGTLHHVGVASSFTRARRHQLLDELAPFVSSLEDHPWRNGFALEGGPTGRLHGAGGRWSPDMELDWCPLHPELVCEVAYEQLDGIRFRHPARFVRWRPDRDAQSCRLDQLGFDAQSATTLL